MRIVPLPACVPRNVTVCWPAPVLKGMEIDAYRMPVGLMVPTSVVSTNTFSDWSERNSAEWAAMSESVYDPFAKVICWLMLLVALDEADLEPLRRRLVPLGVNAAVARDAGVDLVAGVAVGEGPGLVSSDGDSCVPCRKPPVSCATPAGCSKPPSTIGLSAA